MLFRRNIINYKLNTWIVTKLEKGFVKSILECINASNEQYENLRIQQIKKSNSFLEPFLSGKFKSVYGATRIIVKLVQIVLRGYFLLIELIQIHHHPNCFFKLYVSSNTPCNTGFPTPNCTFYIINKTLFLE